ncbi:MAG: hypothetical protein ACXV5Q_10860 [Frankiaceae bacterium]
MPATDRDAAFRAFQRLGDNDNTSGIGLGLALSRDLTRDLTAWAARSPPRAHPAAGSP